MVRALQKTHTWSTTYLNFSPLTGATDQFLPTAFAAMNPFLSHVKSQFVYRNLVITVRIFLYLVYNSCVSVYLFLCLYWSCM